MDEDTVPQDEHIPVDDFHLLVVLAACFLIMAVVWALQPRLDGARRPIPAVPGTTDDTSSPSSPVAASKKGPMPKPRKKK